MLANRAVSRQAGDRSPRPFTLGLFQHSAPARSPFSLVSLGSCCGGGAGEAPGEKGGGLGSVYTKESVQSEGGREVHTDTDISGFLTIPRPCQIAAKSVLPQYYCRVVSLTNHTHSTITGAELPHLINLNLSRSIDRTLSWKRQYPHFLPSWSLAWHAY
jgi:hypothetical protein